MILEVITHAQINLQGAPAPVAPVCLTPLSRHIIRLENAQAQRLAVYGTGNIITLSVIHFHIMQNLLHLTNPLPLQVCDLKEAITTTIVLTRAER